jgi:hypothetical protein
MIEIVEPAFTAERTDRLEPNVIESRIDMAPQAVNFPNKLTPDPNLLALRSESVEPRWHCLRTLISAPRSTRPRMDAVLPNLPAERVEILEPNDT